MIQVYYKYLCKLLVNEPSKHVVKCTRLYGVYLNKSLQIKNEYIKQYKTNQGFINEKSPIVFNEIMRILSFLVQINYLYIQD